MMVPLSEVLALPAVAAAAPVVLHGNVDECLIRWVHSSEIFEVGSLLRGDELLLTTGLGLKGASQRQLERYVESLADAGVAALALELGRTLAGVPAPVLRAARRCDLTLLELHGVTPFESITEAFHDLVIDLKVRGLRSSDRIWRELLDAMLGGEGLQALIRRVADLAGCRARLVARDGRLVATSGEPTRALQSTVATSRAIEIRGTTWGTLALDGQHTALRIAVLDRAVAVLALELQRTMSTYDSSTVVATLLRDMLAGRVPSADDLRSRVGLAGLPTALGRPFIAISVAADRRIPLALLTDTARRACRERFGACVVGQLDDDVVLLTRAPSGPHRSLRPLVTAMGKSMSESIEGTTGYPVFAVVAGGPVDDIGALPKAVAQVREVSLVARRLGARGQALLARDLGVYRLLYQIGAGAGPELWDFVREQIGPLLDHDATCGSDLVVTLEAYVHHGFGKTTTASALGIRRQTLYNRLDRIGSILGSEALTGHASRTALSLALSAWRLRTGTKSAV